MNLAERLRQDMVAALKGKQELRLSTLRMALAAIRVGRSAALMAAADEVGELTAEIVYIKAREGDRVAREIFEMVGRSLGVALSSLINIFNLPLYVLGGGMARGWDAFAPSLLAEVEKRSVVYRASSTRIERSALDTDAGLLGAAYLPVQAHNIARSA